MQTKLLFEHQLIATEQVKNCGGNNIFPKVQLLDQHNKLTQLYIKSTGSLGVDCPLARLWAFHFNDACFFFTFQMNISGNNTHSNRCPVNILQRKIHKTCVNVITNYNFGKYCKALNLKEAPIGGVTYIQKTLTCLTC